MKHKVYIHIIFIVLLSMFVVERINAQEDREHMAHHQIGISINHVHVFKGVADNGKRQTLTLPAWGVDYTYHFSKKWAIGVHTDFIIEKFEIQENTSGTENSESVERSYPIAPAVMGIYTAGHWNFLLGLGGEFASEENYFLTRAGIEYSYELPQEWEIFGTVSYDMKWGGYNSWGIGLGISKSFGAK